LRELSEGHGFAAASQDKTKVSISEYSAKDQGDGIHHRMGLINTLFRTAGSLYRGFGSIQCRLGFAGDLTFCD